MTHHSPGELRSLFAGLAEDERRSLLASFAEASHHCAPQPGQHFAVEDVRKDAVCTDTVGIHLDLDPDRHTTTVRISLGDDIQTLTRALTTILARCLDGQPPDTILSFPDEFITEIVGERLVRQRSQTVYYVLDRLKQAARQLVTNPGGSGPPPPP